MCSRGYIRRPVIWICLIYRYRIRRARAFEIAFVVMRDFPTLIHAKPLFLLMYSFGGDVRDKQTVRYLNLLFRFHEATQLMYRVGLRFDYVHFIVYYCFC